MLLVNLCKLQLMPTFMICELHVVTLHGFMMLLSLRSQPLLVSPAFQVLTMLFVLLQLRLQVLLQLRPHVLTMLFAS